ncbi:unnamed protein product [Spirodela intermedia]|uniref:Methyltransferase n=1 Tax=Spirodela intermedia TaxID=51605 RepID=A0A7I8JHA6_SPIIN|nr:unnamed protein product [Spirodela intermedia]CAA6669526.1 unnamed protein product [Spirodela intermedia]
MKGEHKPATHPSKSSRAVPIILTLIVLCGFSFYLGGIYFSEGKKLFTRNAATAEGASVKSFSTSLQIKATIFPECSSDFQDYTPCTDPKRWRKYGHYRLSFMERHCPPIFERKQCLVPPPAGYKTPIRWPKSRDECWYRNVPYDWINNQKSNQNWLRKEGEKFLFPGGGTMFPKELVASWGGDLLDRGILTVSLAPRDNHEAQIQFALERGIPAVLGIISTQRLPFPANSFDMAHCSRCLIPWTEFGGIYLMEVHRILRPGGFWVLSGPPVNYENRWRGWNTTIEEQRTDFNKLKKLLTSMCFKLYNKKDDIAVWQKSSDSSCYDQLKNPDFYPPLCDDGTDPTRPENFKNLALKATPKWPQRLDATPERLSAVPQASPAAFKHDGSKWKARAKHYKTLLPALGTDQIRNVMDMNTLYGGLAAALIDSPLWVMNVVSFYGLRSLGAVYDRGLIGSYHDWCESFSSYPRTYDLLHVDGLFTMRDEVRAPGDGPAAPPQGYAIIRESKYLVDAIATIAKGMRWDCRSHDTEYKVDTEKVLLCRKKLWYSSSARL